MGERRGVRVYRVLVGKPDGKRALGRPRRRWRIILRRIFRSRVWGYGMDRAGSEKGQEAGTCECGNELSGSIKCGEFLD